VTNMEVNVESLEERLASLSSAEDFLDEFEIEYEPSVVHVNRLHILQRYHDYLVKAEASMPDAEQAQRAVHKALLSKAYQDFVMSNALDEKVFKVFKDATGEAFVALSDVETSA